jgi:hypothetical protein
MLAKPKQIVIKDVIAGLQRTPANDVIVHEPVTTGDVMSIMREASALLRNCEYLSIILVKHK